MVKKSVPNVVQETITILNDTFVDSLLDGELLLKNIPNNDEVLETIFNNAFIQVKDKKSLYKQLTRLVHSDKSSDLSTAPDFMKALAQKNLSDLPMKILKPTFDDQDFFTIKNIYANPLKIIERVSKILLKKILETQDHEQQKTQAFKNLAKLSSYIERDIKIFHKVKQYVSPLRGILRGISGLISFGVIMGIIIYIMAAALAQTLIRMIPIIIENGLLNRLTSGHYKNMRTDWAKIMLYKERIALEQLNNPEQDCDDITTLSDEVLLAKGNEIYEAIVDGESISFSTHSLENLFLAQTARSPSVFKDNTSKWYIKGKVGGKDQVTEIKDLLLLEKFQSYFSTENVPLPYDAQHKELYELITKHKLHTFPDCKEIQINRLLQQQVGWAHFKVVLASVNSSLTAPLPSGIGNKIVAVSGRFLSGLGVLVVVPFISLPLFIIDSAFIVVNNAVIIGLIATKVVSAFVLTIPLYIGDVLIATRDYFKGDEAEVPVKNSRGSKTVAKSPTKESSYASVSRRTPQEERAPTVKQTVEIPASRSTSRNNSQFDNQAGYDAGNKNRLHSASVHDVKSQELEITDSYTMQLD